MKQYIGDISVVEIHSSPQAKHKIASQKISYCEDKDAFAVCNLGDIVAKHGRWQRLLPRVEPFYAVKCNDQREVIQLLSDLGLSFDCASKVEIEKVMKLGVDSSRIIYANPCKQTSYIKYAKKRGVDMMTFDNEIELHKIKAHFPNARLVLRILPPNFRAQCDLGMKFGCQPKEAINLLNTAKDLDLNVMGVSFHVGSGCQESEAYIAAIQDARVVFDQGLELGFDMTLLDIGGGFPGQKGSIVSFEEVVHAINTSLEDYFPESYIRVIAEPGRYYVASAYTLYTNIIAKRTVARDQNTGIDCATADDEPSYMYYVNDGVYGSFNCVLYDHAIINPASWKEQESDFRFSSSIWGPTCDGLDCILQECKLPALDVDDWLYFEDMGAYTFCSGSTFNGIPNPEHFYYCSADIWFSLYPSVENKLNNMKKALPLISCDPDIISVENSTPVDEEYKLYPEK